jgi:hypothetical protein
MHHFTGHGIHGDADPEHAIDTPGLKIVGHEVPPSEGLQQTGQETRGRVSVNLKANSGEHEPNTPNHEKKSGLTRLLRQPGR